MKAVYPGSFDPITKGHIDIIERCREIFDEVVVAVLNNPAKNPMFTVEERMDLIKESTKDIKNISVDSFSGLLVDYVKENNISVIIKGLRAVSDFEYEFQMALANKSLNSEVETFFLMTNNRYSFLSSSLIKDIAKFNGNLSQFVTKNVEDAIFYKLRGV